MVEAPLLGLSRLGKPREAPRLACRQFIEHSTLRCEAHANGGGLQMIPGAILNFVPLLLGIFAAQAGMVQESVTRLVVQDEVIIRVPVIPHPVAPELQWEERKGPKCIPTATIQRALLSGSEQVDFVLAGRGRMRAQLDEDCPALDFYGGFYLQPEDQQICAGRDAIHSRMGGSCTIQRFRHLVPRFRR